MKAFPPCHFRRVAAGTGAVATHVVVRRYTALMPKGRIFFAQLSLHCIKRFFD
jgi:hypothetical protein